MTQMCTQHQPICYLYETDNAVVSIHSFYVYDAVFARDPVSDFNYSDSLCRGGAFFCLHVYVYYLYYTLIIYCHFYILEGSNFLSINRISPNPGLEGVRDVVSFSFSREPNPPDSVFFHSGLLYCQITSLHCICFWILNKRSQLVFVCLRKVVLKIRCV